MKIISIPKGKAKEYAELALNIFKGCTHECEYCYGPTMSRVDRKKYYASPIGIGKSSIA